MSLAQRIHFLHYMFQMTAIALVSVINHYHINGLHPFWNTVYIYKYIFDRPAEIQEKELHLPLHLGVVAIKKGTFGSPSTTAAN